MEIGGRVVVVTGAAAGIGAALARACHAAGAAHVVCADIDEAGARAVAAGIGGTGLRVDMSEAAQIAGLIEMVERDIGPIDLFCSNAGIFTPGGTEVPDADWQRIWEVNVMAHVRAARLLVPLMATRGGGYLLNTASAAGLLNQVGSAPYGVTKHAAVGLAEWLAMTHGDAGIRVSVLCPQGVRTAMTAGMDEGVVAVDGMLDADAVAAACIEGLREERFLILPHAQVRGYMQAKAADTDRWIAGMRRLVRRFARD